MRLYFMRGGHICQVETLADMADEEAIGCAKTLFDARKHEFDGFEIWDHARLVHRHPEPLPKYITNSRPDRISHAPAGHPPERGQELQQQEQGEKFELLV